MCHPCKSWHNKFPYHFCSGYQTNKQSFQDAQIKFSKHCKGTDLCTCLDLSMLVRIFEWWLFPDPYFRTLLTTFHKKVLNFKYWETFLETLLWGWEENFDQWRLYLFSEHPSQKIKCILWCIIWVCKAIGYVYFIWCWLINLHFQYEQSF